MATTTNYSWTTPDDTDLVKDGASCYPHTWFDTSLVDLKGGTTGQVLSKASGTGLVDCYCLQQFQQWWHDFNQHYNMLKHFSYFKLYSTNL
jgi:hypothetical protein